MMRLMRCLPLRTPALLVPFIALLALLATAGIARAATDPVSVRPDTLPNLPAGTTITDQPAAVLPARTQEAVQAGIMSVAIRDFTSGGVTIGRETIATFDDPAFGPEILNGFAGELGTPAIEGDGYSIWRGQVSADGTMALNGIGVTGDDGVVFLALAATVELTDEQLVEVAESYRPKLAVAGASGAAGTGGGSGSSLVNVLVILLAAAMVGGVVWMSRRSTTDAQPPEPAEASQDAEAPQASEAPQAVEPSPSPEPAEPPATVA